jgi:hypothetical protein
MIRVLLFLAGAPLLAPPAQDAKPPRVFRNAVLVSVDGLRSDALIAVPASELPGFARMMQGASTLNARTDPDFTITLPNHTGMITGRFTYGLAGHRWVENDDPPRGATLHQKRGEYVAGIFDVAHDRGWRTAMFAGKSKFSLYDVSWNGEHGAPDVDGADQGRDKIDEYGAFGKSSEVVDAALQALRQGAGGSSAGRLVFAHFAVPDLVGHEHGWDVTPDSKYMRAVASVDRELKRLLEGIEAEESLRGSTVVVLTSDHGGGAPFKSHTDKRMWVDYIIPFLVWTGGAEQPRELYDVNTASRKDPGLKQFPHSFEGVPPIRNGDAGNLVLSLLGLPAVPGSTMNAKQDLRILAP